MEKRKIPFQNYVILGIITIVTFLLLYYFISYYEKRKAYETSMETRMNFLSEIRETEVQNYILDNHDAIIYISDSTNNSYQEFEKQLKILMLKENLTKDVVYLDMYKVGSSFLKSLQHDYFASSLHLDELIYPNVLVVSDGTISSVLYSGTQERNPSKVIEYMKEHLELE